MKTVSFSVSKSDHLLISKIATRARLMAAKARVDYPQMTADMDVTACHANGNPLRLAELLAADDFNFSHDIFGIRRHLDRETGELKDFFVPRFSI